MDKDRNIFKLYPPDAPQELRLKSALMLAASLPLWWPLLCVVLMLMGGILMLTLMFVAVAGLFLPIFAAIGVEETKEKTLKVKVPTEEVSNLVSLSKARGWEVDD